MRAIAIRCNRCLIVVSIAFGISACSNEGALKGTIPTFPAKGTVTMDGKAFGPAKLALNPDDNKKPSVTVMVNESGAITEVTTYKKGDGAPAGTYKATVSLDPMMAAPPHPTNYDDASKTTLLVTIKEGGPNELKLDMDSKAGPMGTGGGIPGIGSAPGGADGSAYKNALNPPSSTKP